MAGYGLIESAGKMVRVGSKVAGRICVKMSDHIVMTVSGRKE